MANAVLTKDQTPTLDWADVTGANEYWAQISADERFTTIEAQSAGLATSTYTPGSNLTDAKKYFWRFRTSTDATYITDQNETTADNTGIALRDAAARTGLAQGFKPDYTLPIKQVTLSMKYKGTPSSSNIWVEIWSDNGGAPDAQVGADSASINMLTLPEFFAGMTFTFASSIPLVAGTQYYLVLQADFAIDGVDHCEWEHSGSNSYADGGPFKADGTPSWTTNGTEDHVFSTKTQTWGDWSPIWSFWLDTTAEATFTPTAWAFIDPDTTTDTYSFAVGPIYAITPNRLPKAAGRNLQGDLLTEYVAVRAGIEMMFDDAFIGYQQVAEIWRFYYMRKAVYLVTYCDNEQDVVENIYRVEFTEMPRFQPLAAGVEDYFRGVITLEEASLS